MIFGLHVMVPKYVAEAILSLAASPTQSAYAPAASALCAISRYSGSGIPTTPIANPIFN
jgi:hypothetical protein